MPDFAQQNFGVHKMISGSMVALVTPMFDDGAVDWKRLDELLDLHLREGT